MNKHKIAKENYLTIRAFDLNVIIEKVYKIKSFNCSLEASSDLSKTHKIGPSTAFYHDPDSVAKAIKKGYCDVDMVFWILIDLWQKKEIEAGHYIVDHSW